MNSDALSSSPSCRAAPGLSPAWLTSKFQQVMGSHILQLGSPEDMILDSNMAVVTYPGRIGGILTNFNANRCTVAAASGRMFSSAGNVAQIKALLLENSIVFKSAIVAAYGTPTVHAYECILDRFDSVTNSVMSRSDISGSWFGGGWTHYVDGIVSTDIPVGGLHVFQANNAANTTTGVRLLGWSGGLRSWPVPVGAYAYFDVEPTVSEQANLNEILAEYYPEIPL